MRSILSAPKGMLPSQKEKQTAGTGKQEGAVLGTGTVGPALNQTPDTDNFNSTEPSGSGSGFEVRQVVLRLGPKKQG